MRWMWGRDGARWGSESVDSFQIDQRFEIPIRRVVARATLVVGGGCAAIDNSGLTIQEMRDQARGRW